MGTLRHVLLALFKPTKGVDGAAAALKWLWIPLAIVLLASVAAKTAVSTPASMAYSKRVADEQLQKQMAEMPAAERKDMEKSLKDSGTQDSADATAGSAIVSTSAMVFALLGAVIAIVYIATFFFIAAKTWANPVGYTTMLSIAGLSLVPHAIRNVVQTIYMTVSGVWLQHSGLGAMVAPASPLEPPGALSAVLAQVDIWVLWGLAILFGALLSQTVGIGRKRAVTGLITFTVLTVVLQAVPTLVTGVFLGAQ
jgi:hypothetical protein